MSVGSSALVAAGVGAAGSIAGGLLSASAAGGAAGDLRTAGAASLEDINRGEREAREIIRQSAARYGGSLRRLKPYERYGAAGSNLLATYLGIPSLYTDRPQLSAFEEAMTRNKAGKVVPLYRERRRGKIRYSPSKARAAYQQALSEFIASRAASPDYGTALRPFTAADFTRDPGYEFRRSEGLRGLSNLYGSQGQFLSGNALRGINEYNQNLASNEYQRAYQRAEDLRNLRLRTAFGLTDVGRESVGQRIAGTGQLADLRNREAEAIERAAQTRSGIAQQIGNVSASERVAKARAYADLFSGVGGAAGDYWARREAEFR